MRRIYGAVIGVALAATLAYAVPPGQVVVQPADTTAINNANTTANSANTTAAAAQATANAASTAAAQAAQAASDASAAALAAQTAANTKCAPMAAVPPMEAVGGAAGSGSNCRLSNSVQPRITRVVPFTTTTGGIATVTWTDMGAVPGVMPVGYATSTATAFPKCAPITGTITSTGATVKCTTAVVTVGLLGTQTSIVDQAVAGITGTVFAIPNS